MTQKLTLLIEEENIAAAKEFAKKHNTTVSALVNQEFEKLKQIKKWSRQKKHPMVAKLAGIIKDERPAHEIMFSNEK
jgi:hypothetical protein